MEFLSTFAKELITGSTLNEKTLKNEPATLSILEDEDYSYPTDSDELS